MTEVPVSFFRVEDNGVLYLSVGYTQTKQGTLAALHSDGELARHLDAGVRPCLDTLQDNILGRLAGEMRAIAAAGLPFVDAAMVFWMNDEIMRVGALAEASPVFGLPEMSPIHSDLWLDNFLVESGGNWYLLDWDFLWLGDPALDWALLVRPPLETWRPVSWEEALPEIAGEPALHERCDLYTRASLLDWVIDPLSNHLAADVAPEYAVGVRASNRDQHLLALDRYCHHFG